MQRLIKKRKQTTLNLNTSDDIHVYGGWQVCCPIICLELAATVKASSANDFCQRNGSLTAIATSYVSMVETLPLCHPVRSPSNVKRYPLDRQTDTL
jgi:hypothetical protein